MLTYKGYYSVVSFDAEQCYLYGKIEGISDLVTFEADTPDDAQPAFEEAVEDYLAFCVETGKAPDRSYKGKFNVRIDSELHKAADKTAAEMGISLNQFVENAIRAAI
ncbi:MAG: type II toxin-antitoxin system HicB family antitoxin [Coriobacteriales bacterium]|nr:type II toxin-antitoxin system HicB family antitoxin [Coriobacteriales bacterium]